MRNPDKKATLEKVLTSGGCNKLIFAILKRSCPLLAFLMVTLSSLAYAQDRANDIKKTLAEIDAQDPIIAAIAATNALHSEDPLLISLALEKSLTSNNARVRSIGFVYLAKERGKLVVTYSPNGPEFERLSESDQAEITSASVLQVEISNFDETTKTFSASVSHWGRAEGAIGQDGMTIVGGRGSMINLKIASDGYLIGTVTHRLQYSYIAFPAKTALP